MDIGIIGATGLVGEEFIKLINSNYLKIKVNNIKLFASSKSINKKVIINNQEYIIEELNDDSFKDLNVAIFCSSSDISLKYTKEAIKSNCIVIDNSSAYRMNKNVPLVIPEVNSNLIELNNGIISNPNCCTILLCTVLAPLHKIYKIKRLIISTYQSASGAGREGLNELSLQMENFNNKNFNTNVFGRQYVNNVFSHNSEINFNNGYNEEEIKIIEETNKILDSNIDISVTCVRVPVFRSHCESVNIEFEETSNLKDIYNILENQQGVEIVDNIKEGKFPEPINTENKFNIQVGRIRYDFNDKDCKKLNLFLSGDQLLKGAALNAYQILNLCQNVNKNKFVLNETYCQ